MHGISALKHHELWKSLYYTTLVLLNTFMKAVNIKKRALKVPRCYVYFRKRCFNRLFLMGMVNHKDIEEKNSFWKCQKSQNENKTSHRCLSRESSASQTIVQWSGAWVIKTVLHTVQHYQVPYVPRFHSISWMHLQKVFVLHQLLSWL